MLKRRPAGSFEESTPEFGPVEIDGLSTLYFETVEDMRAAFASDLMDRTLEDEYEFIDEIYHLLLDERTHVDRF
jgi:hypothetical protein